MKRKLILKLLLIAILTLPFCFIYLDLENDDYIIRLTLNHAFEQAKRQTEEQDDIVFLGDSRLISGIDKEILQKNRPFRFSNLSVGGGSFLESYYLLKYYLENHPAPKVVMLSFVPSLHFFDPAVFGHFRLPTVFQYRFLDLLKTGYVSKYPLSNLENNRKSLGRMIKHLAGLDSLKINRKYPFFGKPFEQVENFYYASGGFCVWARYDWQIDPRRDSFEWDIKAKEQGGINRKESEYLNKIVRLLRNRNIPSVFLLMPVNESAKEVYLNSIHETWSRVLNGAGLDRAYNDPLIYESRYFVDNSHLNVEGRKEYAQYLIESGIWDVILRGRQ